MMIVSQGNREAGGGNTSPGKHEKEATAVKPMVLGNLSYGMYAIGVKDANKPSACIVNTVMQISKATPSDPPLVAVSVDKTNYSCECMEKEGIFTISVLSEETPATVIGALGFVSGRNVEKLENIRHKVLIEGVPVIKENTCCWFLCQVKQVMETQGQKIFVAEIIVGSDEAVGKPMTYQYYVEELGGVSPKKSPTYLPPKLTFDKSSGENFVCSVCGYVYRDPNFGFEELPADWTCPVCKMPKKAFVRKK